MINIEITDTRTNHPKLTIAKDRIALKFHQTLSPEKRAPYLQYAKQIARQVGNPEYTLRGKFAVTQDAVEHITLTTKGKHRGICLRFVKSEKGEYLAKKP